MISEIRRDISLTLFLTITVFLGSATDLCSQNQSRPQFEVASIKPNKSGDLRQGISPSPGRLVATNANVKMLVRYAYNAPDWEIVGEPQWLTQDRFDIDATIGGDSRTQPENILRAMAQSLLET